MGLDMYLYRKTYVQNWQHEPKKHKVIVELDGKERDDIKSERISYVTETMGSWRKFNALHNWFVENVQEGDDNCAEYIVPIEMLKELRTILTDVKKNRGNDKIAEELFPTADGFFFGGTDYDEYYYDNIDYTLEILEEIAKDEEVWRDYTYRSSW